MTDSSQPAVCFSFAAAGWLQMYHFGVAKALQDSGIASAEAIASRDGPKIMFAGSSAGALAASALVVGTDFDALREYACGCAVVCRSDIFGAFKIRNYVRKGVELFATGAFAAATQKMRDRRKEAIAKCKQNRRSVKNRTRVNPNRASSDVDHVNNSSLSPSDDDSSTAEGYESDTGSEVDDTPCVRDMSELLEERLEVYATTVPFLTAKRFTTFKTVEDLDEALTASCLLIPLAGPPMRLRCGDWAIDGGLAAFQPRNGEVGVITVNAMYFANADVRPSVFVPIWWGLYPPRDDQYRELFALGYNDCLNMLVEKRMMPLDRFSELRSRYPNSTKKQAHRGVIALARDFAAFCLFMCVLRPLGLVLVYLEMLIVLSVGAALALLHDFLPTWFSAIVGSQSARWKEGTRSGAWRDVYSAARNLISMRVPLHILLGSKIPVNSKRLSKYSRVYRALRPLLG